MPRIPIYYGDHWESIYGVMLYPHNSEMARHHVAVNHLSVALAEMDLGNMRRVRKETPKRKKAGELIGGVVKALTVLIRADGAADHPPPSWAAAIKHAQKFYWTGARRSYRKPPNCNTSKVKEDLSKFASV